MDMVYPIITHFMDVHLKTTQLPLMVEQYIIKEILHPMSLKMFALSITLQAIMGVQYSVIGIPFPTGSMKTYL